jgi:hypothetical protein
MTIILNAVFGFLIGLLLLVIFAFLGMSIGSLLIGALIIGAVAFFIYLALGMGGMKPPYWISPTVSVIPISIPALAISGPAWTFYVVTVTVLVAGISGAFAGVRLRANNRIAR